MSAEPTVESLLDEFRSAYEAGELLDAGELTSKLPESDRQELLDRIDSYLMQAPRRKWDAEAFAGSPAEQAVERVFESLEGVSGSWPELLPQLRNRARIKRSDLVSRLAQALGFPDRTDSVAEYYNRMEHGQLPAEGVSSRVIEALAEIVGASAEMLRRAGGGAVPPPAPSGSIFLREAMLRDDLDAPAAAAPASPDSQSFLGDSPRRKRGPDPIDQLFTGGDQD